MEFFESSVMNTIFKKKKKLFYNLLVSFTWFLAKEATPLKMNHLSPFMSLAGKELHF